MYCTSTSVGPTVKISECFTQQKNYEKQKYTATARNKINFYRSNHVSNSTENLTEYLRSYYEPTGKISDLTKHYTRHEK